MSVLPLKHMLRAGLCAALLGVGFPAHAQQTPAPAQTEEERVREALRNAIAQARAAEDERGRLQARLTKVEADLSKARGDINALNQKNKELRKIYDDAVAEFKKQVEQYNDALGKWKEAYTEAATVARAKEVDRLKLEGQVKTLEPALKTCQTHNKELYQISRDILKRFEQVDLLEVLERKEPLLGHGRVNLENEVQEYRNKILDRRETSAVRK